MRDAFSQRKSGILLHPTSLPGLFGIGDAGPEARRFAETLARAEQRVWQILPLGPTAFTHSPYQALSSHAGNPLMISLEDLRNDGLVTDDELARYPDLPAEYVDFERVIPAKTALLERICRHFYERADDALKFEFDAFCGEEAYWLDDFALYMAVKESLGGAPWNEWPTALIRRKPENLQQTHFDLENAYDRHCIIQFLFHRQWCALKKYCRDLGIRLVGDIPIFVAHDSADVWSRQHLFHLDRRGRPTRVAGVPPDYFSATGQLWGNPIYRWSRHRSEDFAWWISRLQKTFERADILRIDHFRGLEAYWEIPADEPTAIHGRWVKAPGRALLERVRETFGGLPIIAEDLGVITESVRRLRDDFNLPGMRVLQFAFCDSDDNALLPEHYTENTVVYTGTHDNNTIIGWFNEEPSDLRNADTIARETSTMRKYFKGWSGDLHWDAIRLAMETRGHTSIYPLQDVLGLGASARMNTPGTAYGNWRWRFRWEQWPNETTKRLRALTEATGRANVP